MSDHPTFDIGSVYDKLYEADGEKEVTLTSQEADELLSYLQYVTWLTNPPKNTEWYQTLQARMNEQFRKF
jgi:tetrahydrodipicolinate N-succinyltransferase